MLLDTIFINFCQYGRGGGGKHLKNTLLMKLISVVWPLVFPLLAAYSFKEIMDKGPIFFSLFFYCENPFYIKNLNPW